MPPFIDLTGQRFGRLMVLRRGENDKNNLVRWVCRCDCGRETLSYGTALRGGHSMSCGCVSLEIVTTHGGTGTPEHTIWQMMKQRCTNPKHRSFAAYGGRGIRVCDRWLHSFEAFLADMGERPSPQHTLDRKDNDGPYSPENCKWSTPLEQGANKRTSQVIELHGERHTLSQWAKKLGISKGTVGRRLRAGWPVSEALTQPPSRRPLSKR